MENENRNNETMNRDVENAERTFTQDEVNRIVSERLARERDKRGAELDERENTLKQRELAILAREKLEEAGLNKELFKVLRYNDESELDDAISQLKNIKGFTDGNNAVKGGKKVFITNRLPEGKGDYIEQDKIREAFRFTNRS